MTHIFAIFCVLGFSHLVHAELAAPTRALQPATDSKGTASSTGAASANDFSREVTCAQTLTASPLQNRSDYARVYPGGDGSFLLAANREGKKGFLRVAKNGAEFFDLTQSMEKAKFTAMTEHWLTLPALPSAPGAAASGPVKMYVATDNEDHIKHSVFDFTSSNARDDIPYSPVKGDPANDFKTQNAMVEKMRAMLKFVLANSAKTKMEKEKIAVALGHLVCACEAVTDLKPQTEEIKAAYEKLSTKALPCDALISQISAPPLYARGN